MSHWTNLIPPGGALIVRNPTEKQYEMSDGVEYTAAELLAHKRNIHGIASTTLRFRLDAGMRDIEMIFAKRLPRAPRSNTRAAHTPFNRGGLPL